MFDGHCSTAKEGKVRKARLLVYDEGTVKDAARLEYEDHTEYISAATLMQRIVEGKLWNITA